MSTEETKENKAMDPIVTSSLIALGVSIANKVIEYSDPNLQAPDRAVVEAKFAEYLKRQPMPETYDEGFVNSIMGKIDEWISSKK